MTAAGDAARLCPVPFDDPRPRPGRRLRKALAGLQDFYAGPYRRAFARARQDEDDLFMIIVLSEALGVPNPASYYTIEVLPAVYDQFHDWHRRIGLERSPLEHISCC